VYVKKKRKKDNINDEKGFEKDKSLITETV